MQARYDAQAIVDHHYEATYRQVDQQLEGAHQLVAQRARSPQRPYPIRPKNRVSIEFLINFYGTRRYGKVLSAEKNNELQRLKSTNGNFISIQGNLKYNLS